MTGGARVVPHVTCLGCGCACDDVTVTVHAGRITDLDRACEIGRAWFGDGTAPAAVRVRGVDTTIEQALTFARDLALAARHPLVFLAPGLPSEAQGAAVALADVLRARIATVSAFTMANSILAAQRRGRAFMTLAEIRHRADTLLYWGVDPGRRYPRFSARFTPHPPTLFLNAPRSVIAIDIGRESGPPDADLRIRVAPDEEHAALALLRGMLRHQRLDSLANDLSRRMARVAERLASGQYVVVIHDGEPGEQPRGDRAEGLVALGEALNDRGRGGICTLRAGGNRVGADLVLTWQTGYPMTVDFARGAPRYTPEDGDVDLAIVLGSPDDLPRALHEPIGGRDVIAIGPRVSVGPSSSVSVAIDTAVPGIHESGTAYRLDNVALPLRKVIAGPVASVSIIERLTSALRAGRSEA